MIDEGADSDEEASFIRSGVGKKLFKVPSVRPEYLRPMWEDREYRESLKGKHGIDWKSVHERANLLSMTKKKASAYFSHVVGHGEVKNQHTDKTRYRETYLAMKKDQGISKTNAEIEQFVNSRKT